MKTIKGKEAIELLENCTAIIILDGNSAVTYPSIEGDDEFWNVDCGYSDGDGDEYEYSFKIWADDDIQVKNNQMFLLEANGDTLPIQLLEIMKI